MKLDLGSFAFGSSVESGGNTPSWGTSLGQVKPDLKLTSPGYDNIVIGMVYKSIPVDKVYIPLGKGGHVCNSLEDEGIQLAAMFDKVYVNEIRVNAPFIMLIYKEDSDSWRGRKTLKYSTKIEYRRGSDDIVYNSDFVNAAREALQLADDACWLISDLFIINQEELHMVAGIVNPYQSETYPTAELRKAAFINAIKTTYEENAHFKQLSSADTTSNHSDDQCKSLQQIFYGAPGTGKSHRIKEDVNVREANEKNLVFRTTFHPDSDYSTFVGAYKPTIDKRAVRNVAGDIVKDTNQEKVYEDSITYSFVPQTFLQAYVAAWNNPEENVYLVIEEINRGNCAQIFGDLFQLLDRDCEGFSEYPIMADNDLKKYLSGKDEEGKDVLTNKDGIKDGKIKLPKNLYIWATMNTSDQSLFPIDSAFKRRWDWVYVPIDTKKDNWFIKVGDNRYSWTDFLEKINNEILTDETAEDKHLGFYFCKAENKEITQETFVGKVLFYLWNDVFKVYGIPSIIGSSKDWSYRKFYQTDGKVDEQKVIELMKKLDIAPEGDNENKEDEVEDQ